MDDYLQARTVTTPFGLYDCDVPCNASITVIVSAADAAPDLARPPVFVEAVSTQILERIEWDQSTLTHEPLVLSQAAHVWTRTSLRPTDVDVAELYDGFTINCLSWIEALHGRTHGMGLVHEAIVQLRGGGPRQVRDAKVAAVSSGGLTPSGVLLLRAAT
jgi:hypothetical protein